MKDRDVKVVHGRVRCPAVNGKLERWFRTFRSWLRLGILSLNLRNVQRRMQVFATWYNDHRVHAALRVRTPDEAWSGQDMPEAIPFYAADQPNLSVAVHRYSCRGDPRLPIMHIQIERRAAA